MKPIMPWTDEQDWIQTNLSIRGTLAAMGRKAVILDKCSQQIARAYAELDMVLDDVCPLSCPTCADVCCSRATVWYDLKDLLFIYLNTGTFPDRQISRTVDHSCCNLTLSGCRLQRSARPFICSWYICPDQKRIIESFPDRDKKQALYRTIDTLKAARKELKKTYCNSLPQSN